MTNLTKKQKVAKEREVIAEYLKETYGQKFIIKKYKGFPGYEVSRESIDGWGFIVDDLTKTKAEDLCANLNLELLCILSEKEN